MPDQNAAIQQVQAELLKRFRQLAATLDDATDSDAAQGIVREMGEVTHRITIAGSLLFAAQAQELTDAAAAVRTASNQAAAAVRAYASVKDLITAISGFLQTVDAALDLAKSL